MEYNTLSLQCSDSAGWKYCNTEKGSLKVLTFSMYFMYSVLLQASSQGPPVSAVVYAAAGRWAQRRSSSAVVTVQRVWRHLQIFRLTYLLTFRNSVLSI